MFTELLVRGRVRFVDDPTPPVDIEEIRLDWTLAGPGPSEIDADPSIPWALTWAREHGVSCASDAIFPSEDGTFTMVVPRIPGVFVRARSFRTLPAWQPVPIETTADEAQVDLLLATAPPVRGVVMSDRGKPISDALVTLTCVQTQTGGGSSGVAAARNRLPGVAHSVMQLEADGPFYVSFTVNARTDSDGGFSISRPAEGAVLVVVYASGHEPCAYESNEFPVDDLEFVARSATGTFRLVDGAHPLTGGTLIVADLHYPIAQPNPPTLSISPEGNVAAAWLVPGHAYGLSVRAKGGKRYRGWLEWTGERVVDLAKIHPQTGWRLTLDGPVLTGSDKK